MEVYLVMPTLTRCPVQVCRMLHPVGHPHTPGRHRAEGLAVTWPSDHTPAHRTPGECTQ